MNSVPQYQAAIGCYAPIAQNAQTDETGSVKVTLWASNIKLVSQSIKQGHPYFLFKSVRVKNFLSSPKNLTTMAGSEIKVLKTCPPELSDVKPKNPEDHLQNVNVDRILQLLVSGYSEYAQCIHCKRRITEIATSSDIKCLVCGSSQRYADCNKKANVKVKLAVSSPWLTLFENVWKNVLPEEVHGSEEVTKALLELEFITAIVDTTSRIINEIRIGNNRGASSNQLPTAAQNETSSSHLPVPPNNQISSIQLPNERESGEASPDLFPAPSETPALQVVNRTRKPNETESGEASPDLLPAPSETPAIQVVKRTKKVRNKHCI